MTDNEERTEAPEAGQVWLEPGQIWQHKKEPSKAFQVIREAYRVASSAYRSSWYVRHIDPFTLAPGETWGIWVGDRQNSTLVMQDWKRDKELERRLQDIEQSDKRAD